MENMGKTLVTLRFKEVSIEIEGDPNDGPACLNLAKQKLLEQILETNKLFPIDNYVVTNADALTFNNVRLGMVVEDIEKKNIGVVCKINSKTINVVRSNGIVVSGSPLCFKKVSKLDLSKIYFGKCGFNMSDPKNNIWDVNDRAWAIVRNEVLPVIITKMTKSNFEFVELNAERGFKVNTVYLNNILFENKQSAEEKLKPKK